MTTTADTTTTITVKTWAEAGEWTRGEPALVILRGEFDNGQFLEAQVLHDVALADVDDFDGALRGLGYRAVTGGQVTHTDYGIAFDVEPR